MDNPEKSSSDIQLSDINLGIVCPMANESEIATEFVKSVLTYCTGFKSTTFFVVIDNVSEDDTLEILKDLQQSESKLNVIWSPENKCVVDAYVRGYREALNANCDWILEIDAGFSHQPSDIPQFFEKMLQGYDCVFGSRFCSGGSMPDSSLKRRIISKGGTIAANVLLGTKLKDMTSGFELFTRSSLEMILDKGINSRGHFFQTEIKVHCRKLRIAELPICYRVPSDSIRKSVIQDAFKNLIRMFIMRLSGRL